MTLLSIAGFDPSGGAGILNDIKTFHALNEYGAGVITALTAQNVNKVSGIVPVDVDFIIKQLDSVLKQEKVIHVKTGMLYSPEIIEAVALKIDEYRLRAIVDPVMIAGSGSILSEKNLVKSLKKNLLPLAELTTPNVYEAQELSGVTIKNEEDAQKAAVRIGKICNVIVTGGHLNGDDVLFDGAVKILEGELLETSNIHGSGCTYSAACTSYLDKGFSLEKSVIKAGIFTKNSILNGLKGTLNQFWACKTDKI